MDYDNILHRIFYVNLYMLSNHLIKVQYNYYSHYGKGDKYFRFNRFQMDIKVSKQHYKDILIRNKININSKQLQNMLNMNHGKDNRIHPTIYKFLMDNQGNNLHYKGFILLGMRDNYDVQHRYMLHN